MQLKVYNKVIMLIIFKNSFAFKPIIFCVFQFVCDNFYQKTPLHVFKYLPI